jgi:hypothetical protein
MQKLLECKACPFCGSLTVDICRTNRRACWVQCTECSARTGSKPSRKGAIAMWNSRTNLAARAHIVTDDDATYWETSSGLTVSGDP